MDESSENMSAEEQLVERLRDPSQCRAAFGDVIKLYSEPLYRQIRRMVQTHHDADRHINVHFIFIMDMLGSPDARQVFGSHH